MERGVWGEVRELILRLTVSEQEERSKHSALLNINPAGLDRRKIIIFGLHQKKKK